MIKKLISKNKYIWPNQTYKLLHSKGNHKKKKMKRQLQEWEKIIANDMTKKGLISKYMQTAHTTQQKTKQTTQSKKG